MEIDLTGAEDHNQQTFVTGSLCGTGFKGQALQDDLFRAFGPNTVYEETRKQSASPKQGPWTNHCVKVMVAKREEGDKPAADANSKDPDGLCKAVALAGLLGGRGTGYDDEVVQCVETCQVR